MACTTITDCVEQTTCGCSILLSGLCVQYEGIPLTHIGVSAGNNLEVILTAIDNAVYGLQTNTASSWVATNIGGYAEVYKGESIVSGAQEFRTIRGGNNVSVTQNTSDIKIDVDLSVVGEINTASNVGTGNQVFKQKSGYDLQFRTITGSGGINVTQGADSIDIDGSGISGGSGEVNTASNVGTGDGVFKQKVGYDLQFKKLRGGSNVTLVVGADDIEINAATSGEMNVQTNWDETNTSSDAYLLNKPNIPKRVSVDIGSWVPTTSPYYKTISLVGLFPDNDSPSTVTSIETVLYNDSASQIINTPAITTMIDHQGNMNGATIFVSYNSLLPLSNMNSTSANRGKITITL